MNHAGLTLRRLSYRPESHVELRATGGLVSTSIDFYIQSDDLNPFATALGSFPRHFGDKACNRPTMPVSIFQFIVSQLLSIDLAASFLRGNSRDQIPSSK
jgi:hypothetical protein